MAAARAQVSLLDSWSSISNKTVFVLDRATYFTHVSSGHLIDGDSLKDNKKTAHIYAEHSSIKPFDRSLWTCTVEAVVGYSRLVWDLFSPDERSISILSMGPQVTLPMNETSEPTFIEKICTWQADNQNLEHLMKSLAKKSHAHQVSPPKSLDSTKDISSFPNCTNNSISLVNSLDHALGCLSHLTESQLERQQINKAASKVQQCGNNGRIILISSFQNDNIIQEFINKFESMLKTKNESIREALRQKSDQSTSVNLSPINYCDLVIVNTFPIQDEGPCSKILNASSFRPSVHVKVYSVKSGRTITGLLNNLCLQHHNLKSTTVTGIPMKEEQNASSSSQYDVEIVHCSSIHESIMASDSPLLEGVVEVIDRNGFPCDTFKLSWCTPKTSGAELSHCIATSRITAVDINSRPSACLNNFLLNGRTVMLEIFKSKNQRMMTHFLSGHNGELYIHSLATSSQNKSALAEPPPISDSLGGKVSDYRLNDFISFMKQHTLAPTPTVEDPLMKTCKLIKRQTLYWPLTLGHTILFNIPQLLGSLLQLIPKETLSQRDLDECKAAIDGLVKFEKEGQALPSITLQDLIKAPTSNKGSHNKLDQLYKLLWNELEYFLRIHSTTQEHELILEHLIERNDKRPESSKASKRAAAKQSTSLQPMVKRPKPSGGELIPELNFNNIAVQQNARFFKTGMSVWQTWIQLYHSNNRDSNKLPFVGRLQHVPQQVPPQLLLQQQQQDPSIVAIRTQMI